MDIIDHPARLFERDTEIIALGEAFLNANMARADWTHEAHIAVLVYLLDRQSLAELEPQLAPLWLRSNSAMGIENSDTAGYHHSITIIFARQIARALAALPADTGLCARTNAILQSDTGKRSLPLHYFSQERLFSVAARRGWIAPDLRPL